MTRLFFTVAGIALLAAGIVYGVQSGALPDAGELQRRREEFAVFYAARPLQTQALYGIAYMLIAALSIPLAVPMTLLGGALFGAVTGVLLVSVSATAGATLAFLAARYLFRGHLRAFADKRFPERRAKIDQGIAEEGGYYLLMLRLVPVFPFFLINLVSGLTSLTLRTYIAVSWTGMLPGTAVYVYAGSQLADIRSVSGIFTPGMLAAFALIGVVPLLIKKAVNHRRKKTGKGAL